MEEINEMLEEEGLKEQNNVFVCDDDFKADFCLKKIKEAQDEAARLMALCAAERKEIEEKEEAIAKRVEDSVGYYRTCLYKYFEKIKDEQKHKSKTQESYKLLHGTLLFKKPTVKIARPADDAKLVSYLEQNAPMLVETIKKPAWGDFKKKLVISMDGDVVDTTTGEVLDFVKTEESEADFTVKLD